MRALRLWANRFHSEISSLEKLRRAAEAGRPATVEPLEQRQLLSVSVVRTGAAPNYTVVVSDDAAAFEDNRVELRFNTGTQNLEYSVNGGGFSSDLGGGNTASFANTASIVTTMGTGNDNVSMTLQTLAFNVVVSPDAINTQQTNATLTDSATAHTVSLFVTGAEVLKFGGVDGNDNLTVQAGTGDSTARIQNAPGTFTDEVVASDLVPHVQFGPAPGASVFRSFASFTYAAPAATFGTNIVTVATQNLEGAAAYNVNLDTRDTLAIEGVDSLDDRFTLTRPAVGQVRITDTTPAPVVAVTLSQIGSGAAPRLRINGMGGDDQVNVNVGAAVASDVISNAITFDGGSGHDLIDVFGAPTTTVNEVIYSPGPAVGQGRLKYEDASNAPLMLVDFENIEPAIDLVPAATFTVNANDADNAITYSGVQIIGAGGRVAVDALEAVEFGNKANLTINAQGGDDAVTLGGAPLPPGLTSITVNGGEGNDSLRDVGRAGPLNNLRLVPTAANAGTLVDDSDGSKPATTFTGVDHLTLAVQENDGDGVRVEGTTGNDQIEFFPGATADSGTFRGTMDLNNATGNGPFPLVETTFVGENAPANDLDVNFFNPGGTDSLIYNGTVNDDTIGIGTGEAGGTELRNTLNGQVVSRLEIFNVASILVRGLQGNDTFNANLPAGSSTAALRFEGGDSDHFSDTLNYTAPLAAPITLDLATSTVAATGANATSFSGIEALNVNSSGASSTLTINGTAGNDKLTYTPAGATSGTVTLGGAEPKIAFTGVGNTVAIDPLAGVDSLTVNGTAGGDSIAVNGTTVAVDPNGAAAPAAYKALTYANTESLTVNGQAGDDTFTVTPSATTSIAIDGGQPGASDTLILAADSAGTPFANATNFFVVAQSRTADAGVVRQYQDTPGTGNAPTQLADVAYTGVEVVSPLLSGADPATGQANLLVLRPDRYEQNEARSSATFIGAGAAINLMDLSISPFQGQILNAPADQDWFRYVAAETGTLDFQAYFQAYSTELLPGGGNVDIAVYDAAGNLIGVSATTSSDDRIAIPVVRNQTYFLRVTGAAGGAGWNGYGLTVLNNAAPTPFAVDLQAASDSGGSSTDNVTAVEDPTFDIYVDAARLQEFANLGLTPDVDYDVQVFNNGVLLGDATFVSDSLWQFTATAGQLQEGNSNFITAAVLMRDRATPQVEGRGAISQALQVTLNTTNPKITIGDASISEGNSGTKNLTFTVKLNKSSTKTVTVHYATQGQTATSGVDFVAKSGTVTFLPGQTSKTVTIVIKGDKTPEPDETFLVKLSSPTNATISDNAAVGTINNDDPSSASVLISVNDGGVTEGNSGTRTVTISVKLNKASSKTVTVGWATADGTAKSGSNDYVKASGTLTFAAGQTTKTITLTVKGDVSKESDEDFFVNLFNPSNALLGDGQGRVVIKNDD